MSMHIIATKVVHLSWTHSGYFQVLFTKMFDVVLIDKPCLSQKKQKTAPAISSIIADLNLLLLLFEFEFYLCGRMQPSSVSFDTCSTLCM